MPKRPSDPQEEAHMRADPAAIDAPGGAAAPAEALPGADPVDLLSGSPDLEPQDVLALVAEPAVSQRRARGRPPGAANRKNNDMIAYLSALGHRDPWVTLSLIQSADFGALCQMVGAGNAKSRLAVLAVQKDAAKELMNYHHSRKPQQLDLPAGEGSKRPIMVIGDGNNVAVMAANGFASAEFLPPDESEQNQEVIDGEAVRHSSDKSHD